MFNDNFLIQYNTIESSKFKESIDNNYKPNFIITSIKLLKIIKNMKLSYGSNKILATPNAGGNSVLSEVFSYEILKSAFQCKFFKN